MRENLPVGTRAERGFTIIEGLVASAILLIVAIGILPLFASSILNNTRGSDSTTSSNFSRSAIETAVTLPVDNVAVDIPAGQTKLTLNEWWKPGNGKINDPTQGWVTTAPASGTLSTWTRQTTVEQFQSLATVISGDLSSPYDSSAEDRYVQLKLISTTVQSSKQGGILGGGQQITLQTLKAF